MGWNETGLKFCWTWLVDLLVWYAGTVFKFEENSAVLGEYVITPSNKGHEQLANFTRLWTGLAASDLIHLFLWNLWTCEKMRQRQRT